MIRSYLILFCLSFTLSLLFVIFSASAGKGLYEAPQMNPPTIDGSLADWKVDKLQKEKLQVLGAFVLPENANDLSAKFMAGYNVVTNMLYVAAVVTDDRTYAILPIADPGSWKNDRLEIYIDGDHSKSDTNYTFKTAQQYDIYGPAEEAIKLEGGEKLLLNFGPYPEDRNDFLAAVKRTGTETIYEVGLIVYNEYDKDILKLRPGVTIGFDMAIVDNDDGDDAHSTFFFWTEGPGKFKDETQFGEMIFTSENLAVAPADKLATTWGAIKGF